MKKLIIILSVIFIWGCEKNPIDIPDLPQNPDTSQLEKATLIISGDISDTIIYIYNNSPILIYKWFDTEFNIKHTYLELGINCFIDNWLRCYIPLDTIGAFNCSFNSLYDSGTSLQYGTISNNIKFFQGNMTGEIIKYGNVGNLIEGIILGDLYNDSLNIDFELNFYMYREKDYYY